MVLQAFKIILLALLPLVFSQAGCGEPAPRGKRVLVDHFRWTLSDVPSEHYQAPPEDLECDTELGTVAEELGGEFVYSIYTEYCSYATVTQPALSSVSEGEEFYIRFWRSTLTAPMGFDATVAILIDGHVIWTEQYPIPYPSGLEVIRVEATRDYPEGAQIVYHVDNHGNNEYALVELSVE